MKLNVGRIICVSSGVHGNLDFELLGIYRVIKTFTEENASHEFLDRLIKEGYIEKIDARYFNIP